MHLVNTPSPIHASNFGSSKMLTIDNSESAPMTRLAKSAAADKKSVASSDTLALGANSPGLKSPSQVSTVAPTPESTFANASVNRVFQRPAKSSGSTAFNATFVEHEDSLGVDMSYSGIQANEVSESTGDPLRAMDPEIKVSADEIELGIKILQSFPTFRVYKRLLKIIPYDDPWVSSS